MSLHRVCCCPPIPECPGDCGGTLSSSYSMDLDLQYSYASGTFDGDSCGGDGTIRIQTSGITVQRVATSGVCACISDRYPPFSGDARIKATPYDNTNNPAATLTVTTDADSSCINPCEDRTGSNLSGTVGTYDQSCGILWVVNETDADTSYWYWQLQYWFRSDTTTYPQWSALAQLTSEPQTECHEPDGLTWTGIQLATMPHFRRYATTGVEVRVTTSASGYQCTHGRSTFFPNVMSETSVDVDIS